MNLNPTPEEMLERLVSFNTVSDQSNLGLIDFVENYLGQHGVASHRVPDETGEKASLFARIGPDVDGGVVLSAHTDVVPVEGQNWASDPFRLREENGRLFGRGTSDMKGFAATVLSKVPDFKSSDLKRPIHIALSYDEEIGCLAAPGLADALLAHGPRPEMVIVGEPTNMRVVTGHKGIAVVKTEIRGHPVHSSLLDRGVSAISAAAKLISWLDVQTAQNKAAAQPDCPFDPPYTTLHTGVIHGGEAHNITAQSCVFETDIRILPTDRIDQWVKHYRTYAEREVLPQMQAVHPDCTIEMNIIAEVPGLAEEEDSPAETLVRRITGDNAQHVVVYATEGGVFQSRGLSTVVCGPGSIDQAHQANEYIEKKELFECAAFLDRVVVFLT